MDPYMHDSPSSSVKIKVLATPKMVEDGEDDVEDEEEEEEEDQEEFGGVEYHYEESNLKKTKVSVVSGVLPPGKKGTTSGGGGVAAAPPCCQVEKCEADLSDAKKYHKRHKVCEVHAKSPVVIVAGFRQRFCQQCSRFHVLSEFDDAKRSCRRRLAGHNERRRKISSESGGGGGGGSSHGGSNQYLKEDQCRQVDESGSSHRAFPGDSTLKNVHIH